MLNETANASLERIAAALERLSPPPAAADFHAADAFTWDAAQRAPLPVARPRSITLELLLGVDDAKAALLANTRQFTQGYPANNALLWGARGMGKSSLIKAVHAQINRESPGALAIVEIHREDIAQLPQLMQAVRAARRRCVVFCDDLSFDSGDTSYKALKSALEGGLEGRPEDALFYATSNRRHLMPREMIENERATAINPGEATEEKVSLSDRFGLWLGFHACTREQYFNMVESYAAHLGITLPRDELLQQAALWANTRGARSGRVAWQFMMDLAGRMKMAINA